MSRPLNFKQPLKGNWAHGSTSIYRGEHLGPAEVRPEPHESGQLFPTPASLQPNSAKEEQASLISPRQPTVPIDHHATAGTSSQQSPLLSRRRDQDHTVPPRSRFGGWLPNGWIVLLLIVFGVLLALNVNIQEFQGGLFQAPSKPENVVQASRLATAMQYSQSNSQDLEMLGRSSCRASHRLVPIPAAVFAGAIQEAERLESVIVVELTPQLKDASERSQYRGLQGFQGSLRYARESLALILGALRPLENNMTCSESAHEQELMAIQRAIDQAMDDAGSMVMFGWFRLPGNTNLKLKVDEERRYCRNILDHAFRQLQDGTRILESELMRYSTLDKQLGDISLQLEESLGPTHSEGGSDRSSQCSAAAVHLIEKYFVNAIREAANDGARAQEFEDYYRAL